MAEDRLPTSRPHPQPGPTPVAFEQATIRRRKAPAGRGVAA